MHPKFLGMISKRLAAKVPEETEGERLCFVTNVDDLLQAAAWEYILGKLIQVAAAACALRSWTPRSASG